MIPLDKLNVFALSVPVVIPDDAFNVINDMFVASSCPVEMLVEASNVLVVIPVAAFKVALDTLVTYSSPVLMLVVANNVSVVIPVANRAVPFTSNVKVGEVVPMPTLPTEPPCKINGWTPPLLLKTPILPYPDELLVAIVFINT